MSTSLDETTRQLIAWEQQIEKKCTHEKILKDAKKEQVMRRMEEKEELTNQAAFKQELRRLKVMLRMGLLSPEAHLQLRAAATKKLNEDMVWNRELDKILKALQ